MKKFIVALLALCLILMNIPYAQADPVVKPDPANVFLGTLLIFGGGYFIITGATITDEEKIDAWCEGKEATEDWLAIVGGGVLVLIGIGLISEYYVGTAKGKATDNTYLVLGKRF